MTRRCLLFLMLAGTLFSVKAQGTYSAGIMPGININKKLENGWKLNFKTESRQAFLTGTFGNGSTHHYDYILTDFALTGSSKVGLNNSLAGGYLLRLRGENVIHRLIQQFTIVSSYDYFRLAHRFSADQSFQQNEKMELRLRYRISGDFSLNGQAVDPKEFYLKFGNEYLSAFQGDDYDLEIRIMPAIGYEFNDHNKLEWGLDYRIDSFIHGNPAENNFWLTINWFYNI
ncbi:MAG: DUF2490 domain-containing protein [Sphingobacteriia bacterium]|nr:DUF2490 domain-containing protein [Sphingobacteriia bacterium]